MTTITALPSAPSRADPANFATRADTWNAALVTFVTETNLVASEVNTNKVQTDTNVTTSTTNANSASVSAAAAAASAVAAANSAGAPLWTNSGATYTIGDLRRSSINSRIYRRTTASSAGTTDPSIDIINWQLYNNGPIWVIKSTDYSAISGDALHCNTTSGIMTITLPASPITNDIVSIADYAGTFSINKLVLGRNGSRINGLLEDMDVTASWVRFDAIYVDSTVGWRIL